MYVIDKDYMMPQSVPPCMSLPETLNKWMLAMSVGASPGHRIEMFIGWSRTIGSKPDQNHGIIPYYTILYHIIPYCTIMPYYTTTLIHVEHVGIIMQLFNNHMMPSFHDVSILPSAACMLQLAIIICSCLEPWSTVWQSSSETECLPAKLLWHKHVHW